MKKIKLLLLLIVVSCTNNEIEKPDLNTESLVLKFKSDYKSNNNEDSYLEIIAEITSQSPFKLKSKYLEEIIAINKETGLKTYGYVLIESKKTRNKAKIRHGYFLYGRCFVYGTMIIGDNNETYFIPCSVYDCIGLDPICPGENEGYAK